MLAAFAGWNDALLEMLSKVEHVFKWGIYDRDPLAHWTSGRITLLGDAAHPMMPTLAQGASITLEDAYALARNVARHADDPRRALRAYEAERIDRARRVQLQARDQFNTTKKCRLRRRSAATGSSSTTPPPSRWRSPAKRRLVPRFRSS